MLHSVLWLVAKFDWFGAVQVVYSGFLAQNSCRLLETTLMGAEKLNKNNKDTKL